MANPDDKTNDPANLRFLKALVTVLTATMIGGLLVIIALIVIRFSGDPVEFPDHLQLPQGATAQAFTRGAGWLAIVTDQDQIIIYDSATGTQRQVITIDSQ
jgi:hypothetical protein